MNNNTLADPEYPQLAVRPVGQKIANIYKDRINQFTADGQWAKYNLKSVLYDAKISGDPHVKLWVWHAKDQERPTFEHATKQPFEPTNVGVSFGPSWTTHWFKVELTVPENLLDHEHLELHWDGHNEGLVWSTEGVPLQGLTGNGERIEWILPKHFRDGKPHTFYVEMACNGMFGNAPGGDSIQPPDPNRYFTLSQAEIVAVNLQARALSIDIWIIGDAAREFPQETWQQHKAQDVATRIIEAFDKDDKKSLDRCREIAKEYLGPLVDSADVYKTDKEPQVFGIGHCHIDSCWLWPWAETRRKVARSWTNQCNLMEQYPELNFACSQAQQYKWLETLYPATFKRVKSKIESGQFHPIGGSWVEHDTNMPSGESLSRQFLYGQRFFESRFGIRCQTFWLPDTFGYSGQLPQLCRLAGMDRFLTQKLSWNNINKFPHTTFNWVALDGSQVMCHMPPSETYTAEAHFGDVKRSESQHKSMDQDPRALLVFGKGDGGGGPTWQHLEKLRRCRGMSDEVGLLPRVHLGNSVDDFFDGVKKKASILPTWYGELYFELHRGTYTTQANNKSNNRRAEALMREVEMFAAALSLKDSGYKYPKKDIDEMWEAILLCQFHDCLPGSSIGMCYDDSDVEYKMVFDKGDKLLKEIRERVYGKGDGKLSGLNVLPWEWKKIVSLENGESVVVEGKRDSATVEVTPIQEVVTVSERGVSLETKEDKTHVISTDQFTIKERNGVILSIYDTKHHRELVPAGQKLNQFVVFDDKPLYWQAWDVEVYHLDTRKELSADGPTVATKINALQVQLQTKFTISPKSSLVSYITITGGAGVSAPRIEAKIDVDWHEAMKFLKVEFPVDIRNSEASYETAYGVTKRPTHYNTTWDMAKFEVCCHRFADLSEGNYGVSIINDSKYGFATCGNVMRLSLLRSPKAPDADADMGKHTIKWRVLPHEGPLGVETVRAGVEFNSPLVLEKMGSTQTMAFEKPLVWLESEEEMDSVILDCVKRGEDDEDVSSEGPDSHLPKKKGRSVVVRMYEALGARQRRTLETSFKVDKIFKSNILEDELEELKGREITLRPFEVATFKILVAE